MKAHVFAEGSSTTADTRDKPVKEYYEGLFGMVAGLHEELSEVADTELHVLSEEYGVASGGDKMADISSEEQPVGSDEMVEQAKAALLESAADADVMVVLLSTDVFERTVGEVWEELAGAAKSGSIWCIGAAQSSLDGLDLARLEDKGCTSITYRRVGVARIGTKTREELLDAVQQRAAH